MEEITKLENQRTGVLHSVVEYTDQLEGGLLDSLVYPRLRAQLNDLFVKAIDDRRSYVVQIGKIVPGPLNKETTFMRGPDFKSLAIYATILLENYLEAKVGEYAKLPLVSEPKNQRIVFFEGCEFEREYSRYVNQVLWRRVK